MWKKSDPNLSHPQTELSSEAGHPRLQRRIEYVNSLAEVNVRWPFIVPALAGVLFWEIADNLGPRWRLAATVFHALGACLLAYGVAQWFLSRRWIRRSKFLVYGLWVLLCAGSSWAVVSAIEEYRH